MATLMREFITRYRFRIGDIAKGIDISRHRVNTRVEGIKAWTAPEIIRFHKYLESEGVTVDLGELTRMCAADHKAE
jgi:plasmid maintenance system antidote protein VapI